MTKITLYLDMDGVLANFDKEYRKYDPQKNDRARFRTAVIDYKIFEDLELMPDARQLLDYVASLVDVNIEILTSMGTFDPTQGAAAKSQKLVWLAKHGINYPANFVREKKEKAKYATPNSILVDDSPGCVDPFISAGGNAILHASSEKTISQLGHTLLLIRALNALRGLGFEYNE